MPLDWWRFTWGWPSWVGSDSQTHVSPADEVALFAGMFGRTLVDGMMLWLIYLALEPWVRRLSPWRWIGWSRFLEGRWRDPLVGRDVLLGVLSGIGAAIVTCLLQGLPFWFGWPANYQVVWAWDTPFTEGAGTIFLETQYALQVSLRQFFFFFILFLICRRSWLAATLALLLWHSWLIAGKDAWLEILGSLIFYGLGLFILLRFGFLAYVGYCFTKLMLDDMPVTTDLSAWYATVSTLTLLIIAGLALYGFLVASGLPEFTRRRWADGSAWDGATPT